MILYKIEVQGETVVISRTFTVCEDFSWHASAFSQKLPRAALTEFPDKISVAVTGRKRTLFHCKWDNSIGYISRMFY